MNADLVISSVAESSHARRSQRNTSRDQVRAFCDTVGIADPIVRLEVLEGAGHFTWKDAPQRYWPILTEFVTSTAGRDGY
jgi:pimeloyl-ACP methyl ester carboxylesterase